MAPTSRKTSPSPTPLLPACAAVPETLVAPASVTGQVAGVGVPAGAGPGSTLHWSSVAEAMLTGAQISPPDNVVWAGTVPFVASTTWYLPGARSSPAGLSSTEPS